MNKNTSHPAHEGISEIRRIVRLLHYDRRVSEEIEQVSDVAFRTVADVNLIRRERNSAPSVVLRDFFSERKTAAFRLITYSSLACFSRSLHHSVGYNFRKRQGSVAYPELYSAPRRILLFMLPYCPRSFDKDVVPLEREQVNVRLGLYHNE